MSNIYIQEPPTNGKVLLKTSCGELDIELWSKEAPKACRNFVQLCMEGYYDGTTFHRIIRNFMAQGGDPTGTGEGGESIYGHPFRDEFHSRLRFVRRGLVAMSNAGPHDNSSQFFITLGPCEHLQGKHTIFGKIAGTTVYNAVKLGEVDIGADDRPVYPPKIKATQVLANPFDDIIPRQLKKKQEKEEKKSKSKSKATKNFSLLSFGEEAEEDEEETVVASQSMKHKSKSMHDLVNDPKLSSVPAVEIEKEETPSVEERLHPKPAESDEDDDDDEEEQEEERMREEKKKESADKIRSKLTKEKKKGEEAVKESPKEEKPLSRKEELQEESRKLKEELREGRKRKQKQESHQEQAKVEQDEEINKEETSGKGDELEEFHAQKKKFKAMKKTMVKKGSSREEQTLAMLAKFQNKLHSAILSKKPEPEEEEKQEEEEKEEEEKEEGEYMEGEEEMKEKGEAEEKEEAVDWLVHSLQFESHDSKVKDASVSDADTFTIFDPRNPMNQRRREDSKQKNKDRK